MEKLIFFKLILAELKRGELTTQMAVTGTGTETS